MAAAVHGGRPGLSYRYEDNDADADAQAAHEMESTVCLLASKVSNVGQAAPWFLQHLYLRHCSSMLKSLGVWVDSPTPVALKSVAAHDLPATCRRGDDTNETLGLGTWQDRTKFFSCG